MNEIGCGGLQPVGTLKVTVISGRKGQAHHARRNEGAGDAGRNSDRL